MLAAAEQLNSLQVQCVQKLTTPISYSNMYMYKY